MQLKTLGGVWLEGSKLVRLKPLLLLCYLAHEGPKERRFLVELFWPRTAKGLASLSTTLYRINQEAPEAIQSDELRVWTKLKTDAQDLLNAIQQETFDISLYGGAFVQGLEIPELSEELEEWILTTRDHITQKVQTTLLKQAEKMAALGQFEPAAERIDNLLKLPGSTGLEPEDLLRCYPILLAADHDQAKIVKRQLEEFDVQSNLNPQEAKARLRQIFVGRNQEIETLLSLQAGQWAWLKGSVGLGKTSVLNQLPGRYLSGQSGLPYSTLEPLVGETVQQGAEAILRRLTRQEGFLLVDNWEQCDPESQSIFTKLKTLKGIAKVVISSGLSPAFGVDKLIELSALSKDHLDPSLWRQTGGVPSLVGAYVRGEPLEQALAATLHNLAENARHLYLGLALLQDPDLGLVRRALKLSASDFAEALEALLGAGLAQVSGRVWPRELARAYLQHQPKLLEKLALPLARVLDNNQALPLYQFAKTLWTDEDIPKIQDAYVALAEETLQRGFPKRAVEIIDEVPLNDDLRLLKARALENIGLYKLALESLSDISTNTARVFRARLVWRLGGYQEAVDIASELRMSKHIEIRAEALFTLGLMNWSKGDFIQAEENAAKAVTLWQATLNRAMLAESINVMALARMDGGQPIKQVLEKLDEASVIAANNPFMQARLLLNRATTYQKRKHYQEAIPWFKETIRLTQEHGLIETEARAWNNMGVCYHFQNIIPDAQHSYEQSLKLVREIGETLMVGTTLANIAELTNNQEGWEEAIRILEEGGHHAAVKRLKNNPAYHPVRPQLDPSN